MDKKKKRDIETALDVLLWAYGHDQCSPSEQRAISETRNFLHELLETRP